MNEKKDFRKASILSLFLLAAISAFIYLPFIGKFGYYFDDWYLMYAAKVGGANIFQTIYSIDRPARAWVMKIAYTLFGEVPLYYNISAYFFRLLSAFFFLWILRMLWKRQYTATTLMALIFLIYPGFLSQPNAIDYQSQIISLATGFLSIALTIQTILSDKKIRYLYLVLSILLGWFYLALVEYHIGLEILRVASIVLLVSRKRQHWKQTIATSFQKWIPFSLSPLVFLTWRFFFFHSERGATNIAKQFSTFAESPLLASLWGSVHLVEDVLKVLLSAWSVPLYTSKVEMRLRYALGEFGLGVSLALFSAFILYQLKKKESVSPTSEKDERHWKFEAFILGTLTLFAGQIPITLVNRHVSFLSYSRYTLVGSAGVALLLVTCIYSITKFKTRVAIASFFIFMATLTHYTNNIQYVQEIEQLRSFWWQVSWRVPQMEVGTTLITIYPFGAAAEDYITWGPANFIYYPNVTYKNHVQPNIYAIPLNRDTITKILEKQGEIHQGRRGIRTNEKYSDILILTQPNPNSCVRVINGEEPELSSSDDARIIPIASSSNIHHILPNEPFHSPPEIIFGKEPKHTWCFYYEKASLERQRGNWEEIIAIENEALSSGFSPKDLIEWLPFLQANIIAGNQERVLEIASILEKDSFAAYQSCQILSAMEMTPEMQKIIQQKICTP